MATKGKNNAVREELTFEERVKICANDPFFKKKDEIARKFLEKIGELPPPRKKK